MRGEQNSLHSELVQHVNVVEVFTVPWNIANVGNREIIANLGNQTNISDNVNNQGNHGKRGNHNNHR